MLTHQNLLGEMVGIIRFLVDRIYPVVILVMFKDKPKLNVQLLLNFLILHFAVSLPLVKSLKLEQVTIYLSGKVTAPG